MMKWKYEALTKFGQEIVGVYIGRKSELKEHLLKQQYTVLSIYPILEINTSYLFNNKISERVLAETFEDLYHMLASGMALEEAMLSLAETSSSNTYKILMKVVHFLREGNDLSKSMDQTQAFPSLVVSCVNFGEQSGKLMATIKLLAQFYTYKYQMKGKLFSALVYPVCVFLMLIAVMIFISTKVVPQLKPLLPADALKQPATEFVITFSNFLIHYWFFILLILGVLACAVCIFFIKNKIQFEQYLYRVPVIGEVVKEASVALVFSYLSLMIKSGIPLIKALKELYASMPSYICSQLDQCRSQLLGGASFSDALEAKAFFPKSLIISIKKAEHTVQWDKYLDNISEYFLKRSQSKIETLANLIQPLLIVFGGGFLILVGLAFLVPIYGSLNTIAGG